MSPRVLVVDDSLTVRMELCELLDGAGFELIACETLADARSALADQRVDLVVLDVLLPDGDGVELLRALRSTPQTARVPVIMLSSEADVRDRIRGIRTGADEYVGKPYDPTFLLTRARELTGVRPVATSQRTVVLIDDSPTFRNHLREAFEVAGFRALVATSGEEGLRLVAGVAPDAVVVDGLLPGIGGSTVISRLKSDPRCRRVPCLMLTGSTFDERKDELQALEAGADAYVRKTQDTSVILARVAGLLRRERSSPSEVGSGLLGAKRILAVDDSRTYLHELADQLREGGYDVVLAHSGEEAIELLTVQAVDAILLDLVMPGLSGEETCRRVKSSPAWREIPVVILTARNEDDGMLDLINAGADDYITKSHDFEVLKARLRAQLRRRQYEDDNRRIRDELSKREGEALEARAAQAAAEARAAQAEALRERQAEIESYFAVSPALLCLYGFDGVVKRLSASWTSALGYTLEDLQQGPFIDFVHPDDREITQEVFAGLLLGHPVTAFENRYRAKDGRYHWLLWSAFGDVERGNVCAAAQDVTSRHELEDKLRGQSEELRCQGEELQAQTEELVEQQTELHRKNVELERASQFKSEFLANMSHELRTPLNAVIGFSELLTDDPQLASQHKRYVEYVLASGRHLLTLINDILDLAKIEAGKLTLSMEMVRPAVAIREALSVLQAATLRKRITIRPELGSDRPLHADPVRLRQILLNLLSNAVKFSPEESAIEVGTEPAGERTRLWVRDHGPGIAPELLPKLFRPFVQGEDAMTKRHVGTGLGLAITKRLVEEHGGTITVESAPARGTTFTFTLPNHEGEDDRQVTALARVKPGPPLDPAACPLVLVVEDDVASANLLLTWLTEEGYEVIEAGSAAKALTMAREREPAAILLDIVLGASDDDTDGLQLLRALGAQDGTKAIPVIVTSVLDERRRSLELGAADYFVKPLNRGTLMERLASLVAAPARATSKLLVVIDDDPRVGVLLQPALQDHGYRLLTAQTGAQGLALVRREQPAAVIVDLTLPDMAGREVIEALSRAADTRHIPRLVLTATDLDPSALEQLKPHAQAIARKGDLTLDGLLATVRRLASNLPMVADREPPAVSALPAGPRVLVVDDNDVNRELARVILEGLGIVVILADGGEAGVALAKRHRPLLVLMDLAMPGMDGFAAAAALRADAGTAATPIVAFTALASRADEERVRAAGFDGYLTKPIDRRAMEQMVTAFLPDVGS